MADQADRARHDGQPPAHLPGDLELARDGADGPCGVDRKLFSVLAAGLDGDRIHQLDVSPGEAVGGSDLEQLWGPRVDGLMNRMPDAGDRPLPLFMRGDDLTGQRAEVRARA